MIYLKDTAGHYLLVNRHFERLFKVGDEEIVGKTDYDYFPPEVAALLRANDARVVAEECPIDFEEIVPEDDGDHVFVSVKFPLRDAAGAIYGVCGIWTDIPARKRMEADLRRSEAALSAVVESGAKDSHLVGRPRLPRHGTERRRRFPASLGAEDRAPARRVGHRSSSPVRPAALGGASRPLPCGRALGGRGVGGHRRRLSATSSFH